MANTVKAQTKAYSVTLNKKVVQKYRKQNPNVSLSKVLSDLLERETIKKKDKPFAFLSDPDFKGADFANFKNRKEEQEFYEKIGLTDYVLTCKE